MNERIKFLAEQAEIYAGELIDEGADYDQYPRYYTEKFAQLIVRECRDIVGKTRNQAIDDGWNVEEAMSTAMFDIEGHFGVKQ
jgi:hypothetical protein